ncbi:MAG: DUF2959 family protein [Planctomycetota bacterium]
MYLRIIRILSFIGMIGLFTGCKTVEGVGEDISNLFRGSEEDSETARLFGSLRNESDDAKSELQSSYNELAAILNTPSDELDKQYASYRQSVTELKQQASVLDAEIDATEDELSQYLDEMVDKARTESEYAGRVATRMREQNQEKFSNIFDQARSAHARLLPLIDKMDAKATELKIKIEAQAGQATKLAKTELSDVKAEVDAVVSKMDETINEIETKTNENLEGSE